MRQNVVVVWLECLLVDVVHHQLRGNRGSGGSLTRGFDPPEIYLWVKHGILTPDFLERNIFWYTAQLILSKLKLLPPAVRFYIGLYNFIHRTVAG